MIIGESVRTEVKIALDFIRSVDPQQWKIMDEGNWEVAGIIDIWDKELAFKAMSGTRGAVAATLHNSNFVVLRPENLRFEAWTNELDRHRLLAAILVHEFMHTIVGGSYGEELIPTIRMLQFAIDMKDKKLAEYIKDAIPDIDKVTRGWKFDG